MQEKTNLSDEQLVLLARSGNAESFGELLERYKSTVRACAREFFLIGGETDDLAQEGMLGVCNAVKTYKEGKIAFKNYAYLCARRHIIDAVRRASAKNLSPLGKYVSIYEPNFNALSEEMSPEEKVIDAENRREFWIKLSKILSDFEYRVISMYLNGMTYEEIREGTGKDNKSVDNALSRAKVKIMREFIVK